jgi:hypothetical protein
MLQKREQAPNCGSNEEGNKCYNYESQSCGSYTGNNKKRPQCKADHLLQFSAQVYNA